ncbi:hypothetical protein [Candidatus Nitrosocosmicus sp. FF01]|uniref:hypothetical protein n=1 Tax=Candidatus Nitrosocosmicus sp. FF01 TaxID=3397670 RepID=UPI0039E7D776
MKALSNIEIFGLSFVMVVVLVLYTNLYFDAFGQGNEKKYEMVLESQNYTHKGITGEIVGEILNNGTDTVRAVEVSAIFYNDSGIVGYESDRTDPTTIDSAERAVFVLPIIDEVILSDAENYEFTIKWQDEYSRDYFVRLTGGDIPDNSDSGGDDSDSDSDSDSGGDDSDSDSDSGGDDSDSDSDSDSGGDDSDSDSDSDSGGDDSDSDSDSDSGGDDA